MKPKKKDPKVIAVCGFVVGIIVFTIINILRFEVYSFLYLVMLIVYFFRFLYNLRHERD